MATPVLATKLFIPHPPSKIVTRSRLLHRLNESLSVGHKLTLISAPAGFGKSTLVSEWIAQCGRPIAWLSLDESDNDIARFLIYFISALQTSSPNLGVTVLAALQSQQAPPLESVLTALLNELTTIPNDPSTGSGQGLILVLDDYHLTDNKSIDDALTFLIDHLPPQIHLVITTREDPSLPIPRLRARSQLTELRAADLRFTPSEAAEFLSQVMDLQLSAEQIAALETRTEGWIAGLQLAALSMRGQPDVHRFIQAFAGDHRYIVDYLVEEVLRRQPEDIRDFLLQTSILERLNGPLCDAVISQRGSKSKLEQLQRGNLFLIPLDDKRHWYRYHHLFADVLRMHLVAEQPDYVSTLHCRASEWYEQNGLTADAIHHALAGADFERAANLIERVLPVMRQSRQEATLLGWLQALPDELFQNRPVLSVHHIGMLLQNGKFDGVEDRLQDAERWLDIPADLRERPIFVDEKDFQRLPASVAQYHAAIALARGDVANTMKYAREVLALAPEDDYFLRGGASSLLGLASWTSGDLDTAYRMYSDGMAHLRRIGYISDVIGGSVTLADIRITQGRLREAMNIYDRGLYLATAQAGQVLRGAADMHVGMSELYRERNELDTAAEHLLKSQELGDLNGLPKNPYRWRVAMARIRQAQGNLAGAVELLEEAVPLYNADFSPNVRPASALKTRVWIAQGKLGEALGWAREQGLSVEDELSYLREFEHITLARILLARYKSDGSESTLREVIRLLEHLLKAAEDGRRIGSVIEILILQALAQQALGDISAALLPLGKALTLAEPEGYVRIFLDEGESVKLLIEDLRSMTSTKYVTAETAPASQLIGYIERLLQFFQKEQSGVTNQQSVTLSTDNRQSKGENLIEPLSQRELEILRLLQTELSVPEIAGELVIAASTVRTHTKNIYSKLSVNNRRAAVKRASELSLI